MKFILSSYSYYPLYQGGTEVYVRDIATQLITRGHQVVIVAASGGKPVPGETLLLKTEDASATKYIYEGVEVWSVHLQHKSAAEIYANFKQSWYMFFIELLSANGWADTDHLVLNGFGIVSGLSLVNAVLQLNPKAKVNAIVHTGFICSKHNMIFAGTEKRCSEVIYPKLCSACVISSKTKLPFFLSRMRVFLQDNLQLGKLIPLPSLRLTELISKKFDVLKELDGKINHWIVFSNDMKSFFDKQQFITADKVITIPHGIDKKIFFKDASQQKSAPIKFLYAGRLTEVKGIQVLCKAWLKTEQKENERILYLSGNWRETTLGIDIAEKLKTRKDVVLLDSLSQTELANVYRNTHCVIIPSQGVETGPLILHEAIACGCDIITTDFGGQGELATFYADKAHVFQKDSEEDLCNTIKNYIPKYNASVNSPLSVYEHFEKLQAIILSQ